MVRRRVKIDNSLLPPHHPYQYGGRCECCPLRREYRLRSEWVIKLDWICNQLIELRYCRPGSGKKANPAWGAAAVVQLCAQTFTLGINVRNVIDELGKIDFFFRIRKIDRSKRWCLEFIYSAFGCSSHVQMEREHKQNSSGPSFHSIGNTRKNEDSH